MKVCAYKKHNSTTRLSPLRSKVATMSPMIKSNCLPLMKHVTKASWVIVATERMIGNQDSKQLSKQTLNT